MPRQKRPSATAAEDYDSDNGFVEDVPKSKKAKVSKTKNGKAAGGEAAAGGGVGEKVKGKDGEVFWELSGKRRVGISEFKGNTMVNIREFYEKDGEMLPGKKGISLPVEQFNTIISLLPQLESALAEKGQKIGRPDYSGAGEPAAVDEEEEEEEEPEAKGKKNFEETSDEE